MIVEHPTASAGCIRPVEAYVMVTTCRIMRAVSRTGVCGAASVPQLKYTARSEPPPRQTPSAGLAHAQTTICRARGRRRRASIARHVASIA